MRNALLVASREYVDNARTKGFWIGILVLPIILVISVQVPRFLEKNATPTRNYILVDHSKNLESVVQKTMDDAYQLQVIEELATYASEHMMLPQGTNMPDLESVPAGGIAGMLQEFMNANPEVVEQFIAAGGLSTALNAMEGLLKEDAPEFEAPRRKFQQVSLPSGVASTLQGRELADALTPWLKGDRTLDGERAGEDLFALIEIPADVLGEGKVQYWAVNLADSDLRKKVERSLNQEVRRLEYEKRGMDSGAVREVERASIGLTSLDPRKEAGEEEVSLADEIRQYAPIGFVYFLWIAIMQVASMLLNNTIEEKSNRIIEVLLSSVTAWELMAGKLLGIAGIGLTLVTAWILSMLGILWYFGGQGTEITTQLLDVVLGHGLLPAFAVYFVLGYFLYASIFLAIGSICNTLKESQNFMGPIMMIMMVPLLTMMFIPKDPNGTLATFLSWVPIYTPFVMMNRAAADPPLRDLIGTTVLLIVTNIGMLWLCGRIFRTGILRTGQPPKFRELFRWLRSSA
ncbi:MAG: ABC transporter permease [Planctomycetota bacterium]|nr:ABC transporter permease [Planctomycetota bacterium]